MWINCIKAANSMKMTRRRRHLLIVLLFHSPNYMLLQNCFILSYFIAHRHSVSATRQQLIIAFFPTLISSWLFQLIIVSYLVQSSSWKWASAHHLTKRLSRWMGNEQTIKQPSRTKRHKTLSRNEKKIEEIFLTTQWRKFLPSCKVNFLIFVQSTIKASSLFAALSDLFCRTFGRERKFSQF